MAKEQLIIELITEAKNAINELKQYTGEIKSAQKQVGSFTKIMKSYWAEALVVYAAVKKLTSVVKDLTSTYFESEKVQAMLLSNLKSVGIYTPQLVDELNAYSKEMMFMTGVSDEAITKAQAIAATFTQIGTDIYPEVIERAMDMSVIFGTDLQQSMVQLGKAINDPRMAEGLRRIGITMSEEQVKMIDYFLSIGDIASAQRVILDELKLEIGGAAKAVGETAAGSVAIFKERVGELKEELGFLITGNMPAFIEMATLFIQSITGIIEKLNAAREASEKWRKELESMEQAEIESMLRKVDMQIQEMADHMAPLIKMVDEKAKGWRKARKELEDLWPEYDKLILEQNRYFEALKKLETPQIKAGENHKKTAELVGEEAEQIKKLLETGEQFNESMVLTGDILDAYIEWHQGAKEVVKEEIDLMDIYASSIRRMLAERNEEIETIETITPYYWQAEDAMRAAADATEAFEERQKDLNKIIEDQANTYFPMWAEAWFTVQATVGDAATKMKEAMKGVFSSMLIMLSKWAFQKGLAALLDLMFGRAAGWFALSAGAAVASQSVKGLQLGGKIVAQRKQEGGMLYGDRVPIMAERGEMVIPKEVVRRETPALGAMMAGGKQTINNVIMLDKKVLFRAITEGAEDGQLRTHARSVVK